MPDEKSDDVSVDVQHELLNGFDDEERVISGELKSTQKLKTGLSPKARQYIKFAFVAVMIVIILIGLC